MEVYTSDQIEQIREEIFELQIKHDDNPEQLLDIYEEALLKLLDRMESCYMIPKESAHAKAG